MAYQKPIESDIFTYVITLGGFIKLDFKLFTYMTIVSGLVIMRKEYFTILSDNYLVR